MSRKTQDRRLYNLTEQEEYLLKFMAARNPVGRSFLSVFKRAAVQHHLEWEKHKINVRLKKVKRQDFQVQLEDLIQQPKKSRSEVMGGRLPKAVFSVKV